MSRLVIKYYNDMTQKNSWGCVVPDCNFIRQGNAQLDRALKHATTCDLLQDYDKDLWNEALDESGQGSLGARIGGESHPLPLEHPSKKLKRNGQGTLDVDQLRQTGQKTKEEKLKLYQAKVDHVIMRLMCVRGLVPNVIDSDEWKELMNILNGAYQPTSADTFAKKHIPREAVYVRQLQNDILHDIDNLTLTFDGTSTRKPNSIYTAHATTPSRESYFLDAHQGSGERHTTEWVTGKLLKVCTRYHLTLAHSHSSLSDHPFRW